MTNNVLSTRALLPRNKKENFEKSGFQGLNHQSENLLKQNL
jgi:hypothetical protein